MKVLLVVHGYPPELEGGTERHVQSLAQGLAAKGHEVVVLAGTLDWSPRLRRSSELVDGVRVVKIHRDDLHYERWNRLYHPGVSRLVAELIAEVQPDVMHVHHWLRLTGDLVRQGIVQRVPVVVTLHDFTPSCPVLHRILPDGTWCNTPTETAPCGDCLSGKHHPAGSRDDRVDARLELRRMDFHNELKLASRVFALSRSQMDRMRSVLGSDQPEIEIQPFVTAEKLRCSPNPAPPPPLRVATFGRIGEFKGQHVLLRALSQCRHREHIELHVHGSFESKEYEARLVSLATGCRVVWHGRYDYSDLEQAAYHLVVLPSIGHETYGLILDEARMLGLPSLVSNRGAYPERIGEGGEVFRAGDDADLARRLDRLFEEPARLEGLRRAVQPPHTFDEVLDFVEQKYTVVIAEGISPQQDRFDFARHLELEYSRSDSFERAAEHWRERAEGDSEYR